MTTPLVLSQDDVEAGGDKHEFTNHGIQGDFTYNNNVHSANMSIRLGNFHINFPHPTDFYIVAVVKHKNYNYNLIFNIKQLKIVLI